ncbi:MAG: hypothetical protein WBA99_04680, partial [Nodosilinea sp.]
MTRSAFPLLRTHRSALLAIALGTTLLGSCAEVPEMVLRQEAMSTEADMAMGGATPPAAESGAADTANRSGVTEPVPSDIGQPTPQLVKRASLVLVLTDL